MPAVFGCGKFCLVRVINPECWAVIATTALPVKSAQKVPYDILLTTKIDGLSSAGRKSDKFTIEILLCHGKMIFKMCVNCAFTLVSCFR